MAGGGTNGLHGPTPAVCKVLADVLQLLINQGESVRELRTHPSYSIRSLTIVRAASGRSRAYEHTGEQSEESPGVRLLLHATALLVGSGELLMPMQWEDVGLHANDYGDVRLV